MAAAAPAVPAPAGPHRYGVYLRPDPATCWAVTAVTTQLRAQYGLVSAGAFPPHATLVGSQHVVSDEALLVRALSRALARRPTFGVHNAGPRRLGIGVVYDVHHLADGSTVNAPFLELASAVAEALEPLVTEVAHPRPSHRFDPHTWRGHLSLASHDLLDRSDLVEEVHDYVTGLPVAVPEGFTAEVVALYRTSSDDWAGRWWQSLRWTHLRSWRLGAGQA